MKSGKSLCVSFDNDDVSVEKDGVSVEKDDASVENDGMFRDEGAFGAGIGLERTFLPS